MANTADEVVYQRRLEKAVAYLETYMQDRPELNRLIRTKELNPRSYELAIMMTIDDYNVTAPITGLTLNTFPHLSLLLHGAAIEFLTMAGFIQSRNRLNYNAGGVQVVVSDKAQDYQAWITRFVQDYETKKLNAKKFNNIDTMMEQMDGEGLASEYSTIGGYYW